MIGIGAIWVKYRLQAVWRNYRNPVAFFKKLVKKQVELGLVDESGLSENYKDVSATVWVVTNPYFWLEVILISIFPYPIRTNSGMLVSYFHEETVNWVDQTGVGIPQAEIYQVPYLTSDVLLAFMFLRFYFIIQGLIVLSPVNRLYGKRICHEAGFKPNFAFQLKGVMKMYPYITFTIMSIVSILSFGLLIRIFERPYFTYVLKN